MEQIIVHVDMDAFFAAVEIRDNPNLRGKPLIIGAMPNERGVVSTCSYEARKYGIRSAMNIKEAYRRCPQGIFMHPNFEKYKSVSNALRAIWKNYSDIIETIALDEAYIDLSLLDNIEKARKIAKNIKIRTYDELALTCSVGIGYSKTSAKTASEEKKPNGYFEILSRDDFIRLIINRDIRSIYTVGEKTAEKLYSSGIKTVRDIQQRREDVIAMLGKHGHTISNLAFGIDDRKVTSYKVEDSKSLSREFTFQEDVDDYRFLKEVIFLFAIYIENALFRYSLYGNGVSIKITYANFKTITRSVAIGSVDSSITIYETAIKLLEQVEHNPVRLIGTGVYNLSANDTRQLSFDDICEKYMIDKCNKKSIFLEELGLRYNLDFKTHLHKLYKSDILHKTIEYMRRKNNFVN